jgi:preprotein translocase subunit SecG
MNILIYVLTAALILISLFLILVVLAQKAKSDGGMGAAMGGGMAEAAFGADTSNVLTKMTINLTIAFFVLSFGLYLGHIYQRTHARAEGGALPTITAPAAPASTPSTSTPPVAPSATTTAPATNTAPAGTATQPAKP